MPIVSPPARHRIKRPIQIALLLGALAACACAIIFALSSRDARESTESHGDISLIRRHLKQVTGIDLPASSALIHYRTENLVANPDWIAKVSIPPETPASLAEQILSLDRGAPIATPSLPESTLWWSPQRIATRASLQKTSPRVRIQLILANEPTGPALYIEWSPS